MNLTDTQRKAVEIGQTNMQLIACAGSGKTEVVARRVVRLLSQDRQESLKPENIVAFTFTEKAAVELKDRIIRRTREALGEVTGMVEMFVGTIHAFCLDLIKTEDPKFLKYDVLSDVQQTLFINRHSRKSGLTKSTDLKNSPLRRYSDTGNYISALSILREADLDLENLSDCSVMEGLKCYQSLLGENRFLDYSSILGEAEKMLRNNEDVRARLSQRVEYVIVDEYQDINPVQESIIRSLHEIGANVCVVGDDDQTIYQWRGSDVQNILKFECRYPKVKQIRLEENFRSSEGIIDVAQAFIQQNPNRLPKSMSPRGNQTYHDGDIVALNFETPEKEAQHIAETIDSLRGVEFEENGQSRGLSWSDMAILLRSVKNNGEPITKALKAAKIPYVVTGMTNLFDKPEAEASRQLFYYMASRIDECDLEAAWQRTNIQLNQSSLRHAINNASKTRAILIDPNQTRKKRYSIQRVFMEFINDAGIREEEVPDNQGEIVFFNLGKFSQVISDFETIHFRSAPLQMYQEFANFLQYQVDNAYPEGGQDNQYVNLDAVTILTIHQAKGMEWPVVFIPALLRNRFPSARPAGRTVWHLLPEDGVKNQDRYRNSLEDERRLFYVAVTRSRKYLHMSWAPILGKGNRYRKPSEFWNNVLASKYVKRRCPNYEDRKRLPQQPKPGIANVIFTFSDIKYFFECPYQFKLRILYGFNAPIELALGYGKSLHDALAEVHLRAIRGDIPPSNEVPRLVATHLHVPYAYPELKRRLMNAAEDVLSQYLNDNKSEFEHIEFSEKKVEINLNDGISIIGRIDLVRRIDTNETIIVDLKSSERAQAEDVTEAQLHTYALGYKELTGRDADFVEIYELDEGNRKTRSVDQDFIDDVRYRVYNAAEALRNGELKPNPALNRCQPCDFKGICRSAILNES